MNCVVQNLLQYVADCFWFSCWCTALYQLHSLIILLSVSDSDILLSTVLQAFCSHYLQILRFDPGLVCVRFVVDNVALRQGWFYHSTCLLSMSFHNFYFVIFHSSIFDIMQFCRLSVQSNKVPPPPSIYICVCVYIQGVPGGRDKTSGECSLC